MSDHARDASRRRFLKTTVLGLAALPLASLPFQGKARADEELPPLDEESATAQAVSYVHDADADAPEERQEGHYCNNCALYNEVNEEWGRCAIFPGTVVAAEGWCSAWTPAS